MTPRLTLTIAAIIGFLFSAIIFSVLGFLTEQQFPLVESEAYKDLVTLGCAKASIVFAFVAITFQLRTIEGEVVQIKVILGYSVRLSIVSLSNCTIALFIRYNNKYRTKYYGTARTDSIMRLGQFSTILPKNCVV